MNRDFPAHETCRHKHYRMTCEQFDRLLDEADNSCQVCRLPGWQNSKRMLFIDHDAGRGNWAVRGLLCNTCNTILGKDLEVPRDAAFAAYLENSWFIGMLTTYGVGVDLPDEPPIGSVVDFGGRQPQRMRTKRGGSESYTATHGTPGPGGSSIGRTAPTG
ncbi:endonuclease domain-containing protein [Streptosporangium sp. NPDC050855]|uniref:endonuclease domain-containing protein n=1 Tax=Streptosporangium sp. NPDC050855 TaxID=3366194 RepID=UPI0037BD604A